MRNRSISDETLDALIEMIELLFDLSLKPRDGYLRRGVSLEKAQRMIGHLDLVSMACLWFNSELNLGFDESILMRLSKYHDLAKAVSGDEPRVEAEKSEWPWNVAASMIARLVNRGRSRKERQKEFSESLEKLKPYLREQTPIIGADITATLKLYFLRGGEAKDEARFVHDMGQVIDVHAALWYAWRGYMKRTPYNIRSFTYKLSRRIRNRIARDYWEGVKRRYIQTMELAYDSQSSALSQ